VTDIFEGLAATIFKIMVQRTSVTTLFNVLLTVHSDISV